MIRLEKVDEVGYEFYGLVADRPSRSGLLLTEASQKLVIEFVPLPVRVVTVC
jgi:hypothetical protein